MGATAQRQAMAADSHPLKRTDLKAHERLFRERRARNFEEELKAKGLAVEQRKKLWEALSKYIHDNGCFLVSLPSEKNLRIEAPKNSSLPVKLRELGYAPRHLSTGTRIQAGAFLPVDTIEITLPGK